MSSRKPGSKRSADTCGTCGFDTVGRSVIAPAQIPAGLVVAMIGTPYFLFLLHRSRA